MQQTSFSDDDFVRRLFAVRGATGGKFCISFIFYGIKQPFRLSSLS